MARKRKPTRHHERPAKTPKPVFSSPFKGLKKMLRERSESATRNAAAKSSAVAPVASEVRESEPLDEEALLRQALEGVRPLNAAGSRRIPLEPPAGHSIVSEEAEVLAQLSDLVSGQGSFDITETDEYVEGARVGLDPRLLSRLRKGEFAMQAHIDLHGMIQSAAKQALSAFILDSVRKGLRAVLVVHGRGRGSPGGQPVLKHAAVTWLSQRALSGYVLAFATARPSDGGAGAMYVLLRRQRQRAPFAVMRGAKLRD